MIIILIKSLIAIIGAVVFGIGIRNRATVLNLPEPKANRLLLVSFVVCRLIPFVVIYLILGQNTQSDVPVFYDAASHALQGEIVYRDFWSPYSPLFAYVTAVPLLIWHNAKSVLLLMIVMEGMAWWLTYRFYRPRRGPVVQLVGLLYLVLPAPFMFCVLSGQEDIWMWLFGVVSLWLWARSPNAFYLGLLMAAMLIITKALAVLITAALLFWVRRPMQYMAGLLVAGLPSLAILYALTGEGMLTPLQFASLPFAPNLPTVLAPLIGDFTPYAGWLSAAGLLIVLTLSAYGGWQLRRGRVPYEQALPILWVLCYGCMMFVHKSSFGNYVFIYALPLMLIIPNWGNVRHVTILLVLNVLVSVQPSLWWRLGWPIYSDPAMLRKGSFLAEYLIEIVIVGSVGYFVWLAFRQVKQVSIPASSCLEPQHLSS